MRTYCFNTHMNVFFQLTSASLQSENRPLNTTMALSSKIKRANRNLHFTWISFAGGCDVYDGKFDVCAWIFAWRVGGGWKANPGAHRIQVGWRRRNLSNIGEDLKLSVVQSNSLLEKCETVFLKNVHLQYYLEATKRRPEISFAS